MDQQQSAPISEKAATGMQRNVPPEYADPQQNPYPTQQAMSPQAAPVTPLNQLGEVEAWIDCPFCHRRTRTRVKKPNSSMTYIIATLFCFILIIAAIIPCLAHWCSNVDHYCSECNQRVTHRPYNEGVEVLGPDGSVGNVVPSKYAAGPDLEANVGHGAAK